METTSYWNVECKCGEYKQHGAAYFCFGCCSLVLVEWHHALPAEAHGIDAVGFTKFLKKWEYSNKYALHTEGNRSTINITQRAA